MTFTDRRQFLHGLWSLLTRASFCFALLSATAAQREATADDGLTFEKDAAPILKKYCFRCHGEQKREGGLDLRRRFSIVAGGDGGPAIVAGRPGDSLLITMVNDGLMPPKGQPALPAKQAAVLSRWIESGARIAGKSEPPLADGGNTHAVIDEESRKHWAFQPVRRVAPPRVENSAWFRTPVDAFTLKHLERRSWTPSPAASRSDLIRRVSFDLTGLPPTPAEVANFEHDTAPDAYEKVVDRLLASPQYGERWATHWLDVVRYAESEGFEYDRHLPDGWRFRDYVIQSLNDDKPFDRFLIEQIAGDELEPRSRRHQTAVSFHRLGSVRRNAGNPDIALSRNEVLTERTNIIGEAFLGLTIGCARCHNHKLEPITQKDYYRLQAYLAATAEHDIPLSSAKQDEAWQKLAKSINAKIKTLKEQLVKASGEQKQQLESQIAKLANSIPPRPPTIASIRNDLQNRTAIHVLRRGIWEHKGVAVGPRPPSVLVADAEPEAAVDVAQPRLRLARWLASEANPLTARVIVNRLWQHHFGAGLVKTPNNFGTHGERPSHPQLLDWLTQSFIAGGWRWKPLHRTIVLSNTYRQSSRDRLTHLYEETDPENRLLWRFNRRRLSAEEIRDAMLAVSGQMSPKAFGPSVMLPVDAELVALLYNPAQWKVTADSSEHDRRSIYLIAKRNLRLPFMEAFDAPALQTSCPVRETSTHAPQALELLNGDFANRMAAAFADRLAAECGNDVARMVDRAYHLGLGRRPTDKERDLSLEFLRDQPLKEFALAVLNLNGFLYVH